MKNLYNIYDGDRKILSEVTPKEIRDNFHLSSFNASNYNGARKNKIKGRYRVEIARKAPRREGQAKNIMTPKDRREWENVCNIFQGIEWVKTGGFNLTRAYQNRQL